MSYTDVFGGQTVPPSEYSYVKYELTEDTQLFWPAATPPGELSVAKITDISSAVPVIVTLYRADQLSVGFDFIVSNTGSALVVVNDYAGGELYAIDPGSKIYLYLVQNTSEAGLWTTTEYGASTSEAQAIDLVGAGLGSQDGKLVLNAPTVLINSDYTVQAEDLGHILVVRTGSVTIDLPNRALLDPEGFYFFFRNDSAGIATLDGFSADEVDGSLTKVFSPGEAALLFSTDFGWLSVGYGRDVSFAFTEFVVNAAAANPILSPSDVSGRMIRVAGVATEDKIITLPPLVGIYFAVTESGLGTYLTTFTTGLGSEVILPANQATVLYSDGTNVRVAITTSVIASLALEDGSAAAPSVTWITDPDTGFFRQGSNSVGFSAGGTLRFTLQTTGYNGPAVITGGSVAGITDLAIADGGTGASDATAARLNLGLDQVDNTSDADKPLSDDAIAALLLVATKATVLTAGDGLTGGGDLSTDREFTLGTPGTLDEASTNAVTADSHTHAVTFPVTSVAGDTGDVVLTRADVGAFPGSVTTTAVSKTLAVGEFCTVTAAGVVLTLPITPSPGDTVGAAIVGVIEDTEFDRNGENIMSLADNLTIDKGNVTVTLTFADSTSGWRIV